MSNLLIAITAYLIDRFLGELKFFRHPNEYIKDAALWFLKNYYQDSFFRGVYFVAFMVVSFGFIAILLEEYISYFFTLLNIVTSAFIASLFITHRALRNSVEKVLASENQLELLGELLGEKCKQMSKTQIHKNLIEYYAKNLSSQVIAPLFYLILFNLPGIIIYKTIQIIDTMVGYETQKYELFGKTTALLNDALNYIPSRLTAVLIMLLGSQKDIFAFYEDGEKCKSPNSGHPIAAMALALGVQLRGGSSHFGEGRKIITQEDVKKALGFARF